MIATDTLIEKLTNFIINTECFAHFAVRLFEHFILASPKLKTVIEGKCLSPKDSLLFILTGLMKTNDYETIVASLSFIGSLLDKDNIQKIFFAVKSLLPLLCKLLRQKQLEYM